VDPVAPFPSLAAERDSIGAEIARLKMELSRVERHLLRPRSRDRRLLAFVLGLLAGLAVACGVTVWALSGLSTAIGNFD
jgi:hypothetical protein